MGAPLALAVARLGIKVRAFDKRPDRLAFLAERGVASASSLDDLVGGADVVAIAVMADVDVERLEQEGLLDLIRPGSGLIIHSTVRPRTCQRIAEKCAARGIRVVDATVSGTIDSAYAGKLSVMVSGDPDLTDQCRTLFDSMGSSVLYLGPKHGMAALGKVINNGIGLCNMATLLEGVRIAVHQGMPAEDMVKVIVASSGQSFWATNWGGAEAFVHGHPLGADVIEAMLVKDLALAGELGTEVQVEGSMLRAARETLPSTLRSYLAAQTT